MDGWRLRRGLSLSPLRGQLPHQRELDFTVRLVRGSLILWTGYWREGLAVIG